MRLSLIAKPGSFFGRGGGVPPAVFCRLAGGGIGEAAFFGGGGGVFFAVAAALNLVAFLARSIAVFAEVRSSGVAKVED